MNKKFWKWRDDVENEKRELIINGAIAEESWLDDDITPELFKAELNKRNGDITIWINSSGGDCIAASRIYSMLMDYKGYVKVIIDGLAASAASVIAMAGNEVIMSPTSMMMIHNPLTVVYGNKYDLEKEIEILDEIKESIINAYEIKTDLSRSKISKLMDDETWMNAKKAIELGFADGFLSKCENTSCEDEGYVYQRNLTERAAVNKIISKQLKGRSITELMERLKLIKN